MDTSTITITPEYAAHFLEVYAKKTDGAKELWQAPASNRLSVAKTEGVRSQSRTESARRAAETRKARKRAVDQI